MWSGGRRSCPETARSGLITSISFSGNSDTGEEIELMPLRQAVSGVERKLIRKTLAATNGNKAKAAELLQIDIKTLRTKMTEHSHRVARLFPQKFWYSLRLEQGTFPSQAVNFTSLFSPSQNINLLKNNNLHVVQYLQL